MPGNGEGEDRRGMDGKTDTTRRWVERLLPQERFDALNDEGAKTGQTNAAGVANAVIGKQCAGMGARKRIGADTLVRLLNGQEEPDPSFRAEGAARLRWAFSAMGPKDYALLRDEAGVALADLARKKREVEGRPDSLDAASAWLNAALRDAERAEATRERDARLAAVGYAAAHGRLTILVGAGASKGDPANVPLYRELALKYGATEEEIMEPGKFFDKMKKREGYGLHRELAEEIAQFRTPSKIHEQLIVLMQEAGAKHLVTTNWDELLEAAAQQSGVPLEVWEPDRRKPGDGRITEGIVHLHGTVRAPGSMLVTEQEMQEHYEDGRTPDEVGFLTEILSGRTVLCVGYSHDDVMVAEIQRKVAERENAQRGERREAQGRPRKTYSLVRREGPKDAWAGKLRKMEALGIEAIVYRDHDEVPHLLGKVITGVRRDAAWERDRLNTLGERGAVPGTDWGKIRDILAQGGAKLRHFLQKATPRRWQCEEFLEAGGRRPFTEITASETGKELSWWLCRDLDGERLKAVLWMAAKTGGRFARPMWDTLGRELGRRGVELDAAEREAATLLLIEQAESLGDLHHTAMVMCEMCRRCNREGRYEPALQAWRLLTKAKAVCEIRLRGLESDTVEEIGEVAPALACETWETREFWEKAIRPILAEVHAKVWRIGFETMEAYQTIADSGSATGEGWNGWAYTRKAIEPHEQDSVTQEEAEGAVIDAVRDALDAVEQEGPSGRQEWERRIAESAQATSPLLRRIAAYGVERTKHWDDIRKLRWATQRGRLDDGCMQHEMFSLCATAWDGADTAARKAFVEKVQDMRRHSDEASEWARYRLIGYLGQRATSAEDLEGQRKALQKKHPGWTIPEHPDLGSWSRTMWIGPNSPAGWTPGNLLQEWDSRGEHLLDEIIEKWEAPTEARSPEEWPSELNEQGRRKAIEDTIDKRTTFGIALARALHAKGKWDHPGWLAICNALGAKTAEQPVRAILEADFWTKVMEGKQGGCVGELVRRSAEKANAEGWPLEVTTALQDRFVAWTPMLVKHDREPNGDDWVQWSINTPGGKAVEATLTMTRNSEDAASANRQVLRKLTGLARICEKTARHVRILSANRARWLLHIDREWTEANLIRVTEEVGEYGPERGEIWNGLAYAQWDVTLFNAMKRALNREVRFARAPNENGSALSGSREDTAARILAMGLSGGIFAGAGKGKYEGEHLDGIGRRRRTRMVRAVCRNFRHEEEFRDAQAWKKLIDPMWDEIVEMRGGTTAEEQEAFLRCFAYLDGKDQEKFREQFVKGAPVAPEGFLDEYDQERAVENRTAAIEVALHCAGDFTRQDPWKWDETLETLRAWKKDPKAPEEVRMIERVLALAGEQE